MCHDGLLIINMLLIKFCFKTKVIVKFFFYLAQFIHFLGALRTIYACLFDMRTSFLHVLIHMDVILQLDGTAGTTGTFINLGQKKKKKKISPKIVIFKRVSSLSFTTFGDEYFVLPVGCYCTTQTNFKKTILSSDQQNSQNYAICAAQSQAKFQVVYGKQNSTAVDPVEGF